MTSTPRTDEALHDTANDFRALGAAVKQDLSVLRDEARTRIDDARTRIDGYTQKAVGEAHQSVDQIRDYAVQNPLRALAYAALGGVFLGLFLRR